MGTTPETLRFTDDIDWSKPDTINAEGLRVFSVRCRVPLPPMSTRALPVGEVARDAAAVDLTALAAEMGVQLRDLGDLGHNGDGGDRVIIDDGDGIELDPDASGDDGSDDEVALGKSLISGIASSTSVDFFGTEMSTRALKMMAVQMARAGGLVYIPRHNRGLAGSIEWDEVIGRTVHAEVVPTEQVAKAFNEVESQWLLRVTIELYKDEPLAQALLRRIARGEEIGQSIGGWFTHLQILQNEDGDVERVIVQGVELDHLAVTRAPANPDSVGLVQLRSALDTSAAQHRARHLLPRVVNGQTVCTTPTIARSISDMATDQRHLLEVIDNGDGTASITLAMGAEPDDDSEESTHAPARSTSAEPGPEPAAQRVGADAASDPALDTQGATGDDAEATHARRSALPTDDLSTLAVSNAASSKEPPMSAEEATTQVSLDALRSVINDAVQPLSARLDAIENAAERTTPTPEPAPAPAPEPTVDQRVVAAEAAAEHALARAKTAEGALAAANRRPMRQGRSVVPSFGTGPAARTGYDGLVDACRSAAPTVAAVAERCVTTVAETDGAAKVTRAQCHQTLTAMLNAAEADGIITDPNHRAVWQ